jgi:DNA-binding IclR family transcriptional regulator
LFQINPDECVRLLTRLVQEGFLRQTPDGRFRLPS